MGRNRERGRHSQPREGAGGSSPIAGAVLVILLLGFLGLGAASLMQTLTGMPVVIAGADVFEAAMPVLPLVGALACLVGLLAIRSSGRNERMEEEAAYEPPALQTVPVPAPEESFPAPVLPAPALPAPSPEAASVPADVLSSAPAQDELLMTAGSVQAELPPVPPAQVAVPAPAEPMLEPMPPPEPLTEPVTEPVTEPLSEPAPMVDPAPVVQPPPIVQPAPPVEPTGVVEAAPVVDPAPPPVLGSEWAFGPKRGRR